MGDSLKVLFEIPVATISFSPSGSVSEGTEITVTMSLSKLEADSDTSTKDYVFRADVKDSNSGDVDQCEDQANGYGLGVDRHMWKVDEDPETRTGTISADCPVGAYTLRVSISTPDNVELASDSTIFTVVDPGPPLSNDATLSGLTLSGITMAFDSANAEYTANVANAVEETTVTPTVNNGGATYAVKLDGVADGDGTVSLAVGSNVITVEVTAEDGRTVKTYTVTVTRANAGPKPSSPPDSPDAPTGEVTGKGRVALNWNDVEGATYYQVRSWLNGKWEELPTKEVGIVIDGSGAEVSNLPNGSYLYFSVQAGNGAGVSDWSIYWDCQILNSNPLGTTRTALSRVHFG